MLHELPFVALAAGAFFGCLCVPLVWKPLVTSFPNSDSELKGSTSGQKIGPEDTVQGLPTTCVLKPGTVLFIAIYMTW